MKKSLITMALMAACAVPAMAQSSVSIYGVVDAGLEHTNSAGVSNTSIVSGAQSGSRIGFKGVEDLGSGLSTKFVIEQGFNVDTGAEATAGVAFSRQAWLGLSSATMGEVRLGRQETPLYKTVVGIDPFGAGLAGNALGILGAGTYTTRANNAVTYVSPSMSGVTASAQYSFGEVANQSDANEKLSANVAYVAGPLMVSGAYSTEKFNAVAQDDKKTDYIVGGTYDFQVVKAHVGFAESTLKNNLTANEITARNYLVGVSVPMGAHTVLASLVQNESKGIADTTTQQYALGYTYTMSKRTNVYASLSHVKNDSATGLASMAVGSGANKYNVGIRHKF